MEEQSQSHHKSLTHTIIILMLVALMTIETATLGYVITKLGPPSVGLPSVVQKSAALPPIFYTRSAGTGYPHLHNELVMVDRETGNESVLFNGGQSQMIRLAAVPQRGYTGKIYLDIFGEGTEHFGMFFHEMDVKTKAVKRLPGDYFGLNDYFAVSPDQTKIVVVSEIDEAGIDGDLPGNIMVLDLVKNETYFAGGQGWILGENEHWATELNHLGWTPDVNLAWVSDTCFIATVYGERSDGGQGLDVVDADRRFCVVNGVIEQR